MTFKGMGQNQRIKRKNQELLFLKNVAFFSKMHKIIYIQVQGRIEKKALF